MSTSSSITSFWSFPWSYRQALVVGLGLIITGWLLEWSTRYYHLPQLPWPINGFILLIFVLIIISLALFWSTHPIVSWLASTSVAVTSSSYLWILAMVGGIIPQQSSGHSFWWDRLALTQLFNSWTFGLCLLWLLLSLGITIAIRTKKWTIRDWPFYCFHFGIWLALSAAFFGSSDIKRYQMVLEEGQTLAHGLDKVKKPHELPFAIHLKDFTMETYDPLFGIINKATNKFVEDFEKIEFKLEKGFKTTIMDWPMEVLEYYAMAVNMAGIYREVNAPGAVPAIKLKVMTKDKTEEKWLTCGNFAYATESIDLGDYQLVMRQPKPRTYRSSITLLTPEGSEEDRVIEVNHPLKIKGWKVYQYSYDQAKGRWSRLSVFEVIKDPWLKVVYAGLIMVLIGMVWLLITGRFKKRIPRS